MTTTSVVIATYNRALLVRRAVISVLAQKADDIEVIVVDDGSTDDTEAVVRAFGEPVRYVRRDNGERGAARNTGIAAAGGEVIAFLDSDDEWLPGHLERIHNAFAAGDDVGLVYAGAECVDDKTSRVFFVGPTAPLDGDPVVAAAAANPFPFSATAVRRRVLDEVGGFDEDRALSGAEDWELFLRCLTVTRAEFARGVGARLHFHGDNTVANPVRMEQAFRVATAKWREHPEVAQRVVGYERAVSAGLVVMIGRAYLAAGDRSGARRRLFHELIRSPTLLTVPTVAKTLGRALLPLPRPGFR